MSGRGCVVRLLDLDSSAASASFEWEERKEGTPLPHHYTPNLSLVQGRSLPLLPCLSSQLTHHRTAHTALKLKHSDSPLPHTARSHIPSCTQWPSL